MLTVFVTVWGSPAKGGTDAERKARAMHPPVAVPANGGPVTSAWVTRPDGANVTETFATPLGSPADLQPLAWPIAPPSAAAAADRSNSPPAAAVAVGFAGGVVVGPGVAAGVVAVGSAPLTSLPVRAGGALLAGSADVVGSGADATGSGGGAGVAAGFSGIVAWVAVGVDVCATLAGGLGSLRLPDAR
jgi:hypothetical protein